MTRFRVSREGKAYQKYRTIHISGISRFSGVIREGGKDDLSGKLCQRFRVKFHSRVGPSRLPVVNQSRQRDSFSLFADGDFGTFHEKVVDFDDFAIPKANAPSRFSLAD